MIEITVWHEKCVETHYVGHDNPFQRVWVPVIEITVWYEKCVETHYAGHDNPFQRVWVISLRFQPQQLPQRLGQPNDLRLLRR